MFRKLLELDTADTVIVHHCTLEDTPLATRDQIDGRTNAKLSERSIVMKYAK